MARRSTSGVPGGGSGEMFDAIAPRYDLLNRILSLGADRRWRRRVAAALALRPGAVLLDLATGTADLAIQVARGASQISVVGLDPSTNMLALARRKIDAAGLTGRIVLLRGDAQRLPFADGRFDGVSVAFGVRNFSDRPRALREAVRVLRPGGRVAILELSEPRRGWLSSAARFHIHKVVPRIGAWLSGAAEYGYLQRSIAAFPPPDIFVDLMRASGLVDVSVESMSFGACCLYVGATDSATRTQREPHQSL